jgi:hypothetical protein
VNGDDGREDCTMWRSLTFWVVLTGSLAGWAAFIWLVVR